MKRVYNKNLKLGLTLDLSNLSQVFEAVDILGLLYEIKDFENSDGCKPSSAHKNHLSVGQFSPI